LEIISFDLKLYFHFVGLESHRKKSMGNSGDVSVIHSSRIGNETGISVMG
jgi:hypothetical protein